MGFNNDPWNRNGGNLAPGGPPNPNVQQSGPSYTFDNQYKNDAGFQNRNSYGGIVGGADQAVNRYREMGSSGAQRGAYQADYSGFNNASANANWDRSTAGDARNQQQDALAMLRQGATGAAPSAAEMLGRRQTDDSIDASMSIAASARGGPMAQAAALDAAQKQGVATRALANRDIMATRANEMANYRNAYMGGAGAIRQGDFGQQGLDQGAMGLNLQKTGQDIQNEQFQRGLNQNDQQFYENLANQVNLAQLGANQAASREADQAWAAQRGATMGDEQFGFDKLTKIVGGAAQATSGVAGGIATSDLASKQYAIPMSGNGSEIPRQEPASSSSDRSAPMGSLPPWMPPYSLPPSTLLTSDKESKQQARELGRQEGVAAAADAGWLDNYMGGQPAGSYGNHAEAAKIRGSFGQDASGAPIAPLARTNSGEPDATAHYADQFDPSLGSMGDRAAAAAAPPPVAGMPAKMSPGMGAFVGGMGGLGAGLSGAPRAYPGPTTYSDPTAKTGLMPMSQSGGLDAPTKSFLGGNVFSGLNQENDEIAGMSNGGHANHMGPGLGAVGGHGFLTISDARAKRAAFIEGQNYGGIIADSAARGVEPPPMKVPEYMADEKEPTILERIARAGEAVQGPSSIYGRMALAAAYPPVGIASQAAHIGYHGTQAAANHPKEAGRLAGQLATSPGLSVAESAGDALKSSVDGITAPPPAQAAPPAQMMDAIGGGKTFKYKPGVPDADPNEQQFGTTTQDLRRTPMGASMVVTDPRTGYQAIDTRKAVGPILAATGNLNQRVRELEAERSSRRDRGR